MCGSSSREKDLNPCNWQCSHCSASKAKKATKCRYEMPHLASGNKHKFKRSHFAALIPSQAKSGL